MMTGAEIDRAEHAVDLLLPPASELQQALDFVEHLHVGRKAGLDRMLREDALGEGVDGADRRGSRDRPARPRPAPGRWHPSPGRGSGARTLRGSATRNSLAAASVKVIAAISRIGTPRSQDERHHAVDELLGLPRARAGLDEQQLVEAVDGDAPPDRVVDQRGLRAHAARPRRAVIRVPRATRSWKTAELRAPTPSRRTARPGRPGHNSSKSQNAQFSLRAVEPTRLAGRGREDAAVDTVDDLADHLAEPLRRRVRRGRTSSRPNPPRSDTYQYAASTALDAQPLPGRLGVQRKLQPSAGPDRIVLHALGARRAGDRSCSRAPPGCHRAADRCDRPGPGTGRTAPLGTVISTAARTFEAERKLDRLRHRTVVHPPLAVGHEELQHLGFDLFPVQRPQHGLPGEPAGLGVGRELGHDLLHPPDRVRAATAHPPAPARTPAGPVPPQRTVPSTACTNVPRSSGENSSRRSGSSSTGIRNTLAEEVAERARAPTFEAGRGHDLTRRRRRDERGDSADVAVPTCEFVRRPGAARFDTRGDTGGGGERVGSPHPRRRRPRSPTRRDRDHRPWPRRRCGGARPGTTRPRPRRPTRRVRRSRWRTRAHRAGATPSPRGTATAADLAVVRRSPRAKDTTR